MHTQNPKIAAVMVDNINIWWLPEEADHKLIADDSGMFGITPHAAKQD
jgi:hypothetical protein